jgi:hypothetical protein
MQAADAATMRTALSLGTIATQAANAVAITGGTILGLTNLGVSMANNTAMTGISLGTITDTTARPLVVSQTWNNAGLNGRGFDVKITATATATWNADTAPNYAFTVGSATQPIFGISLAASEGFPAIRLGDSNSAHTLLKLCNGYFIVRRVDTYDCVALGVLGNGTTGVTVAARGCIGFNGTMNLMGGGNSGADCFFTSNAAAWMQMGGDSATPIAQTLSGADGSGTNIVGGNITFASGRGTGSAAGGDIIFSLSRSGGSSGTTQGTNVEAVRMLATGAVEIKNATTVPASNPAGGGYLYIEAGALKFRGSGGTVTTIANA